MEIKVPKTVSDLRIKHFAALSNPLYSEITDDETACRFIADFTGQDYDLILTCDKYELKRIYNHALRIYSQIKLGPPPKTMTFGGIEYSLVDPEKVGTGWHIDFSKIDMAEDPVRAACLFYYPTGVKYGQKDTNKNLLYPIAARYNTIAQEMPLEVFINASAFFLTKTERSIRLSMEIGKVQKRTISILTHMSGRSLLTRLRRSSSAETGSK